MSSSSEPMSTVSPTVIPRRPRCRYWLAVIWTWTCLIVWTVISKGALVIVYFFFIAAGIVYLAPESAQLLSTLPFPFFSYLDDYEATHELQVAHAAAELLLVLSFVSWHFLLRWVLSDEFKETFRSWQWNSQWVERVLLTSAIVIVVGDAGLFYESFTYSAFGGSTFSAKAFIGTMVYAVILVMSNFVSLYLSQRVREAQEKE